MHLSTLTIAFAAVGLVSSAAIPKAKRQLGSILDTTQKNGIPLLNEWIDTYDLTPLVNTPSIIDVPSSVVDIFSDEVSSTANLVTGTVDAVADGVNGAVEDIFDVEPAFPEERKKKRQIGSLLEVTQHVTTPSVPTADLLPVVNVASGLGYAAGDATQNIFEDAADVVTTVGDGVSNVVVDIFDVEPAFPEER